MHVSTQWETKQVLLSAFVKLINVHPQLKPQITELLEKQTRTIDAEVPSVLTLLVQKYKC